MTRAPLWPAQLGEVTQPPKVAQRTLPQTAEEYERQSRSEDEKKLQAHSQLAAKHAGYHALRALQYLSRNLLSWVRNGQAWQPCTAR